jgi:hypothetical protein
MIDNTSGSRYGGGRGLAERELDDCVSDGEIEDVFR